MKKENNPVWRFFASVKLALFTLFILATASIIGTIIPQNKEVSFYVQQFGESWARIFQVLDFQDMYHSWWFLGLLGLFSLNLIICTLERLPNVWRMMVQDNLSTDPSRLEKMGNRKTFKTAEPQDSSATSVQNILSKAGWKTRQANKDDGILLFSQKGAWTRLGVYMVHLSILIIFVGAIIGARFGYKGSVMIAEATGHDQIYLFDGANTPVPLGFQVRCNFFTVDYYDNGQPKEYRSDLEVIDNGQPVLSKMIEVNDPLEYKGFTFYQSSYQALDNDFLTTIENTTTNATRQFSLPPRKKFAWKEEGLSFGIVNISRSQKFGKYRFKIWFSDDKASPSEFWVEEEAPVFIERPEATYSFTIKQRYATGLQVAKDPGVWTVYAGCTLMLFGLYVAFFLSHRRIWAFITPSDGGTKVLVSGTTQKNKFGFEKEFESLAERFRQSGKFDAAT